MRKAAQAQHQWTTSAWAEASYPLCSLLRYQLAWCVAQLLLESKQYCFFIFITALKSIGDSRLDEHEAFLQLPCRCRLANIHWTLMNRIKGPQLFSLYEKTYGKHMNSSQHSHRQSLHSHGGWDFLQSLKLNLTNSSPFWCLLILLSWSKSYHKISNLYFLLAMLLQI